MKNFPVFVFPVSLEFYLNARHTYKQLLTVYNPYDFPVNFKVLCTSPNKYTVIDPEGVIAAQSCIEIVVRYTQPAAHAAHSATHAHAAGAGAVDKFRITMYDRNTQQALGKRDIPTKVVEGEPAGGGGGGGVAESLAAAAMGDSFHPLTRRDRDTPSRTDEHSGAGAGAHERAACSHPAHYSREQQPVNVVAVAVSICCIAALLLPTQPEPIADTQWPDWLHIGANLKLVFSFVLGLVSMLVLRP